MIDSTSFGSKKHNQLPTHYTCLVQPFLNPIPLLVSKLVMDSIQTR